MDVTEFIEHFGPMRGDRQWSLFDKLLPAYEEYEFPWDGESYGAGFCWGLFMFSAKSWPKDRNVATGLPIFGGWRLISLKNYSGGFAGLERIDQDLDSIIRSLEDVADHQPNLADSFRRCPRGRVASRLMNEWISDEHSLGTAVIDFGVYVLTMMKRRSSRAHRKTFPTGTRSDTVSPIAAAAEDDEVIPHLPPRRGPGL